MRKTERMVVCPHCGAEIKAEAVACRYCGSDERTGWSENTYLDGIGLPEDEEYQDLVEKEFGGSGGRRKWGRFLTAFIGALLALLLAVGFAIVGFL